MFYESINNAQDDAEIPMNMDANLSNYLSIYAIFRVHAEWTIQ